MSTSSLKIGIIDSGVDISNEHLARFIRKSVDITTRSQMVDDEIGHGTACATLITRGFDPSDIELYVYKAFASDFGTEVGAFKESLLQAINDEVDVLNCSVGTIDPEARYELGETIELAQEKGIIIVCAWNDDDYTTWDQILRNCDESIPIRSGLNHDPEGIDTLVVGYLDKASEVQRKDLLSQAMQYALQKGINVFSFLPPKDYEGWCERFRSAGLHLESPQISFQSATTILQGVEERKAFDTPILGVFGTSSKQGKFTLQLMLRYELMERGYRVGQIGTEHQSCAFGIDFTFPSGYGASSSLQMPLDYHIPLLRRVISQLDNQDFDTIIVGGQSGLMNPDPYYYGCLPSELFLSGCLPDRVLLVKNQNDPPQLVDRIEKFIYAKTGQPVYRIISFEEIQTRGSFFVESFVNELVS